jgi:acetyl-CoA carboxylase beta subunit
MLCLMVGGEHNTLWNAVISTTNRHKHTHTHTQNSDQFLEVSECLSEMYNQKPSSQTHWCIYCRLHMKIVNDTLICLKKS